MDANESSDQVTCWILRLAKGDETAAPAIWKRYFHRLVSLARGKLEGTPQRASDAEDVALSAMNSFFRGAEKGRFPCLADRDELWRLLVTITARKAVAERRRQHAKKRGNAKVRGESAFLGASEPTDARGIEQVLSKEPAPELAAMIAETCRVLLERLDEAPLRTVALLKMEGFTNEEIAARLDCTSRTVERKLNRIRAQWEGYAPAEESQS
jgi:DNA-directed RNA polymerase specialized sigma24 family protein